MNYGLNKHIVARLSFQILDILEKCNIALDEREKLQKVYAEQLMPQLIKMLEIEKWYSEKFNEQIQTYEQNVKNGNKNHLPYIPLLTEECHTFFHGYKKFVGSVLAVFNVLYKTNYQEASEFYLGNKKRSTISLIEFAENNFGNSDLKTLFLKKSAENIRTFIALRNAIVHPDGYSGTFKISNFELCDDGNFEEPCWWREESNEKEIDKTSIRMGFKVAIHDLLTLAEDIFISWADEHLIHPSLMQLMVIPKEIRDPHCPVKYKMQYVLPPEIKSALNKEE